MHRLKCHQRCDLNEFSHFCYLFNEYFFLKKNQSANKIKAYISAFTAVFPLEQKNEKLIVSLFLYSFYRSALVLLNSNCCLHQLIYLRQEAKYQKQHFLPVVRIHIILIRIRIRILKYDFHQFYKSSNLDQGNGLGQISGSAMWTLIWIRIQAMDYDRDQDPGLKYTRDPNTDP